MTDKNPKKQDKDGGVNVGAMVTGAVVGAGVVAAGIAGAFLQKKENREKVKVALTDAKDKAEGFVEDVKQQVQEKSNEI